MTTPRLRLLFVAEGVTLAHVGRPLVLAEAMAARGHEVTFATPERYRRWVPRSLRWRALHALRPETFAARLASGRRLYSQGQLKGYIADDLNLIRKTRPDVVIGDFRLSLAASARTSGVPYAAIANAYWSPQRRLRPPTPVLNGASPLPAWAAGLLFRVATPWALRWHATAISEVLAPHGVDVGRDLQRAYTEADLTLYADLPSLFPEVTTSARERFIGPVAWSPSVPLPAWWAQLPKDRPLAYLTLGSSGDAVAAPQLAEALVAEGYAVIAATAGRGKLAGRDGEVFVTDYLPGETACARAELVVCNGGSPGVNQALAAGRPVLGVCSNLDQMLNMQAVTAAGAGLALRSDRLGPGRLRRAIRRLGRAEFGDAAKGLMAEGAGISSADALSDAIALLTERQGQR
jgi:UDP:flavonoid glycosyltransferase YjiC (YdhE family)